MNSPANPPKKAHKSPSSPRPKPATQLSKEWFARDATEVARDLLGKIIKFGDCSGMIVETEAYTTDAASHGRTLTKRSELMHTTYGHWYVYFTYGMHYCVNVTTNKCGVGAVLIRAIEPVSGVEVMKERRGIEDIKKLCNGPAKLCKALGISITENGMPIEEPLTIYDAPSLPDTEIASGPRIGITRDTELPWRFWVKDSPYRSR